MATNINSESHSCGLNSDLDHLTANCSASEVELDMIHRLTRADLTKALVSLFSQTCHQ